MTSNLQQLVHEALLGTRNVDGAALISIKKPECKAASKNFLLDEEQCTNCVTAFNNPPQVREDGFELNNALYNVVRADRNSIYCKTGTGSGLILVKTEQHVIVTHYSPPMYPSVCVEATEKLADYFRAKGH